MSFEIEGRKYYLLVYEPNASINKYALSQKALFTIVVEPQFDDGANNTAVELKRLMTMDVSDFDLVKVFETGEYGLSHKCSGAGVCKKIIFPKHLSRTLLEELDKSFISYHRLFPDLKGVCHSIMNELWHRR